MSYLPFSFNKNVGAIIKCYNSYMENLQKHQLCTDKVGKYLTKVLSLSMCKSLVVIVENRILNKKVSQIRPINLIQK